MSKDKKSYKEQNGTTRVGDFLRKLTGVAPDILDFAGKVTGVNGLSILADKIKNTDTITEKDKELALKELEYDMIEAKEISNRWSSDMQSDSWWAKNIRPLSLAFLTLNLFIYIILDSSVEGFKIDKEWIDLLSSLLLLVYGGYFGARALEKITRIRKDN